MSAADSGYPVGPDEPNDPLETLGYDPDEASDCTAPEHLDLRDKSQLLKWKFLEGGDRLPVFMQKIPHVDETDIFSSVLQDELSFMQLAKKLAGDAKQIQTEFVYAKQRFDLLQQEKDLLKWHIASNSKVMKLKEGRVDGIETRNRVLERKIKDVRVEGDRYDRERTALSVSYKKVEDDLDTLTQDYEQIRKEMEEWLSRRGDYLADTTLERRKADHERRLRQRQFKKLARACAVDKKWHVRIEATRNADTMILDGYDSASKLLQIEFERAGDITGPIRQIIVGQKDQDNPLEDFVSTAQAQRL